MHFDGFDFSGKSAWGEGDDHTGLEDSSLDSTDGHCSDTSDFVDVLEGNSEWLVRRSLGWLEGIESFDQGGSLVPWEIGGSLEHVVSVPSRDGDEGNLLGVVSDLLDKSGDFGLDFVESGLAVRDRLVIHLVDDADHLLDSQGVSQKSVLSGLSSLGNTGFELSLSGSDDENGAIGLRSTSNHVLDEISVAWGVDDGEVVFRRLELPEGNVDGDSSLSLGLELVQDPGVLEGGLSDFLGFLLELLNGSLVDSSTFVDEMSSGS